MFYVSSVNLNLTPSLFLGWVLWVVRLWEAQLQNTFYKITIVSKSGSYVRCE